MFNILNQQINNKQICYIGSNEQNLLITQKLLLQQYRLDYNEHCHIGLGGYYNFDVASWRQSKRIIIFDYNSDQISLLKRTIILIDQCQFREDFVKHMINYLDNKQHIMKFNCNSSADPSYEDFKRHCFEDRFEVMELKCELYRPSSWLNTDSSYKYIRNLVLNNKVDIISLDIRQTEIFKQLAEILNSHHIVIDTVYLSNVMDFMKFEELKLFYQSLSYIVKMDSLVITAEKALDFTQMVMTGRRFLKY
jgi:hypothetical protein